MPKCVLAYKYVAENNDCAEKYNFMPLYIENEGEYCFGFVETKATRGKQNQLKLENIYDCENCGKEDKVDDVLVVFCALNPYGGVKGTCAVVGWYKNATVYRYCNELDVTDNNDDVYEQYYNIKAKKSDCVLLPDTKRGRIEWVVPRNKDGKGYGFGQANVWYGKSEKKEVEVKNFINKLTKSIEEYDGENWVDKEIK